MNHADTFRWISIAVSIILGLGVARLLTAAVAQFHARRHRTLDWLPITWAATIFLQQLVFWWSLDELIIIVPRWTMGGFALLVGLALMLFLAAALILPHSDTGRTLGMRDFFEEDGRFALPILAAFNVLALIADRVFWSVELTSEAVALNVVLILLPLVAFRAARPLQATATLAYAVIAVGGTIDIAPATY
ncbi:MAG: hypothetical protein U1E70_00205 [Acetobacteraceae bacterium]|nr:hypothetical protein [Pseudomonadota bacterium]